MTKIEPLALRALKTTSTYHCYFFKIFLIAKRDKITEKIGHCICSFTQKIDIQCLFGIMLSWWHKYCGEKASTHVPRKMSWGLGCGNYCNPYIVQIYLITGPLTSENTQTSILISEFWNYYCWVPIVPRSYD